MENPRNDVCCCAGRRCLGHEVESPALLALMGLLAEAEAKLNAEEAARRDALVRKDAELSLEAGR